MQLVPVCHHLVRIKVVTHLACTCTSNCLAFIELLSYVPTQVLLSINIYQCVLQIAIIQFARLGLTYMAVNIMEREEGWRRPADRREQAKRKQALHKTT